MNKDELTHGMVVKDREGSFYLCCLSSFCFEKFIDLTFDGYMDLKSYNDDLTVKSENHEYDIVEVYKDFTLKNRIYKRNMSIKEIEQGMIVQLRNGNSYMVTISDNEDTDNYLLTELSSGEFWKYLEEDFDADLIYSHRFKNLDIVKVYENIDDWKNDKVMWKREDK